MRVGILGCGGIAHKLAPVFKACDGVELIACASRTKQKAEEFALKYDIKHAHGSYEDLYKDSEVDLIYVATPMSAHYENMIDCINNGKAILCEKSFTVTAEEAEKVYALAKEKNVLVAEAIWTRYMPSRFLINELINQGLIGEVSSIEANLSYTINRIERIWKRELGGGAILDIGVYPINFALMAREGVGIKSISGSAVKNENGVDMKDSMTIIFEDGVIASLTADTFTNSNRKGLIYGTKGYLEVNNINDPDRIDIYGGERGNIGLLDTITIEHEISGYEYQIYACKDALEKGKITVDEMPPAESIRVMDLMDKFRAIF